MRGLRGSWRVLGALVVVFASQGGADDPVAPDGISRTQLPGATSEARSGKTVRRDFRSKKTMSSRDLTEREQVRTLPEALRSVPGVVVQKTSHGQGSPFIRGFTGFRTLYLIDGIRLNNSVFREGPNQYAATVDPLGLSSLEVLKGTGSSLFGSDAVGGVVQAHTKSAGDFSEGRRGTFHARFADAENSYVGRLETGFTLDERWGFYLGGSSKAFGTLRGGPAVGEMPTTAYREFSGEFKAQYKLSDLIAVTAAFQRHQVDDAWRTHSTIYGKSWSGTAVGTDLRRSLDQNRELAYLKLEAQSPWSKRGTTLTVSRHVQSEDEDRLRPSGANPGEQQGFRVISSGLQLLSAADASYGTWNFGGSFYRDTVSSYKNLLNPLGQISVRDIQGPVGDEALYDLFGLFVENEMELPGGWNAIFGGRYTYAYAQARKVKDPSTNQEVSIAQAWNAPILSARAEKPLDSGKTTKMFVGVSQAFRAPNLSDLTRFDINRSNEIETPSPGLRPERFVGYDVGLRRDIGALTGEIAYFFTSINEMVVRQPTGAIVNSKQEVRKINSGAGYVQGLELALNLALGGGIETFLQLTLQDGFIDGYPTSAPLQQREWLSRLSPATTVIGASLTLDEAWKFEALVTNAQNQNRLSAADQLDTQRIPPGGTPGYTIATLRGQWRPSKDLSVQAAVENIGDADYRVHGSGLNEPGRNFVASVTQSF